LPADEESHVRQSGIDFLRPSERSAAKPALIWRDAPVADFGALPARVGHYRAALVRLGVKRGDRVMVKSENSPAFVYTYLAVLALGAIFVPMNSAYTAPEVALLIEDAEPALLVHASATPVPDEATSPVRRIVLEPDGSGALTDLALGWSPIWRWKRWPAMISPRSSSPPAHRTAQGRDADPRQPVEQCRGAI